MPGLLRFSHVAKRDPAITEWFAAQPVQLRALAKPWFTRMRRCGPDVREILHDGVATACVGDVPFAYVGVFSAHVTIGFFHGADLRGSAAVLEGTGRHMRHVKLRPGAASDDSALASIIAAAYNDARMRLMAEEKA